MEDEKHFMAFSDIWPKINDIRCLSWREKTLGNRMAMLELVFFRKQTPNKVNKSTFKSSSRPRGLIPPWMIRRG